MHGFSLPDRFFSHDAQAGGFDPHYHVDIGIDIAEFGQYQNILIEGIRGTGKTHILRMVESNRLANFEQQRILPIYVSLAQISEHTRKDPDEFRILLYSHIATRTIETLETHRPFLQPDKNLVRKATLAIQKLFGDQSGSPDFDDAIEKIKEVLKQLRDELYYGVEAESTTLATNETNEINKSVATKTGLKVASAEFEASGSASHQASTIQQLENMVSKVRKQLEQQNASQFLIDFLREVQKLFNLEYSVLLLDECSEAKFDAQVEIFRLFKAIRGAPSALAHQANCAFFMGTVYPQEETYYPKRSKDGFAFEPGQDCTLEYLQWDETDLEAYIQFFENLLLRRAKHILGYTGSFEDFVKTVFDHTEAFLLAAICSHGIPRRFWQILRSAYDRISQKISLKSVAIAVQDIANNQILGSGELDDKDLKLLHGISQMLAGTNFNNRKSKSRGSRGRNPQTIHCLIEPTLKSEFRRLIMQGAIHDKARTRTIKRRQAPQLVYALDLAIAYTHRAIPQANFVRDIQKEVSVAPDRNFAQAIKIGQDEYYQIFNPPPPIQQSKRERGTVKSFNGNTGKGLIISSNNEIFFNNRSIDKSVKQPLKEGDVVEFTMRTTPEPSNKKKYPQAKNITLVNE